MAHFKWTIHPILLEWPPVQLGWYSCFLCLGWLVSFSCFDRQTDRFGYSREGDIIKSISLFLFFIGARLGTLLEVDQLTLYSENWFLLFSLRQGGLVGQLGGLCSLMGIAILHRIQQPKGVPLLLLLDWIGKSLLPCLVLSRIGNFFNHEVLGLKTDSFLGVIFIYAEGPQRFLSVHPVQLYEALGYCIGYFIAWKTTDKGDYTGIFFSKLCLTLGSIRFVLEFFKSDLESGFPSLGQLLSLPFMSLGLLLLYWLRREKTLV